MFQKFKSKAAALVAVPLTTLAISAHAELPSEVSTAITSVGADLKTAASMVITAMVAFWGLRKLGSKMGWW